jgi:predicted Zn finger-like uncharacterized protein
MLTRCPACTTTFRVTPDQLKARAGMVRCGKCQEVFNALDTLVEASPVAAPTPIPEAGAATSPQSPASLADGPPQIAQTQDNNGENTAISSEIVDILLEDVATSTGAESPAIDSTSAEALSPEALRDTVVAAGLVAARETTEAPGYNKWAEGAFTGATTIAEPPTRTTWPFTLAAIVLIGALAGQLAHHFRAELAVGSPGLRPLLEAGCAILECDIPLPRHSEMVSIESSDLQIDPTRGGMLTLSATLKNRAAYAQSWPLLEITLTDVQDNAVLRRVLEPAEYLPAKVDPTIFPPNGEVGIRLWLEAKETAAAGYRLYVFYP